MTEAEARDWLRERFGARKVEQMRHFVDLLIAENQRQNLVSPASISSIWVRHILDSAQLVDLAGCSATQWIDIGTGGGFPGLVVALVFDGRVTLVEPRRRRAAFLQSAVDMLEIGKRVQVLDSAVEHIRESGDVISARAVASVEKLLQASMHCARPKARWVLPRGRTMLDDLTSLARRYQVVFHVEQSLTDLGSAILVADRL